MSSELTTNFSKLSVGKQYYLHRQITEYIGTFSHVAENKTNGYMIFIRGGKPQVIDIQLLNNISESSKFTPESLNKESILNYNDVYCAGL